VEAAAEVDRIRSALEELAASVPERDDPLTYYHEVDDTLYTVTSQTFIGEIYALAGLENVADPADPDGAAGGYPQLSAEFLVDADPDLIFLADTVCCGQTAQTVAARPGWDALSAVQAGRIIELDDDIASRWGPRVVDFLETIVAAVAEVEAVPAG
jgi:iron complex transport system substrate-binding protein